MSEPLQLVVLLVIEELQRGDFLVWPFADPTLIAYGRTREEAIFYVQPDSANPELRRIAPVPPPTVYYDSSTAAPTR